MFNIISFSFDNFSSYGYDKVYSLENAKRQIVTVKNLTEATNYKNRNNLIALNEYDLEEGAIRIIAERKKACFLIDLSKIINTCGVTRAILISKIRTFLKFCNKYGAYYTFADFAKNEFDLRTARELIHISFLLGLNPGQAKLAIKMLKHYLE